MTRTTHITRRDPFAELHAIADAAFGRSPGRRPVNLFAPWGLAPNPARSGSGSGIPVNLFETEEGIGLEFSLPGFSEGEIGVTIEDGLLTVAAGHKSETGNGPDEGSGEAPVEAEAGAERCYTRREISRVALERSFRIGNEYDPESATASLANGMLELTLARRPEAQPKQIPISVGSGA